MEDYPMKRLVVLSSLLLLGSPAAFAQAPAAPAATPMAAAQAANAALPLPLRRHDANMTVTTTAFADGGVLGPAYLMTAGPDAPSPNLTWSAPPEGTKSFALIMHDLDVVANLTDGTHWLVFNIPGTSRGLPEGVPKIARLPDGSVQPLVNRRINGFFPPGAPPAFYHHYVIEVYALDTMLPLDEKASREDMIKAIDGHILDRGILTVRAHR
jgi:Raf kinase inhibitor-like YbhB/YbcL family protein